MSSQQYEDEPSQFSLEFPDSNMDIARVARKITATFAVVLNDEGKILALKNERGWDIPGGHLEGNETVEAATHREVLEEACVTIQNLKLFALINNSDTAMSVFTAEPDIIRPFIQNSEDPTSDRTFMDMNTFRELYSGGDKRTMFSLLDRLEVTGQS